MRSSASSETVVKQEEAAARKRTGGELEQEKGGSTLKRGIDGSVLKLTAILTMTVDHIGAVLIEMGILCAENQAAMNAVLATAAGEKWLHFDYLLRGVGRISFPIFCFLLVEGFLHTRNVKKYGGRLLVFAFISEIPFDLAFSDRWLDMSAQNIFFTLLIGLLVMAGLKRYEDGYAIRILILALGCTVAEVLRTDYGAYGVFLIAVLYLLHGRRLLAPVAGAMMVLESFTLLGAAVFSLIPMLLYNGERGSLRMKYFFYCYYPAHLLILYLCRGLLLSG